MLSPSPAKKVTFAEQSMPSAIHKKKPSEGSLGKPIEGYSPASQKVAQILRRLESDITEHYNAGDAKKRNKALVDYC